MYIYLDMNDKERLKMLATKMGVIVPYEYHQHGMSQQYIMDHNGNIQVVKSDTWLVDMFEEMEIRIKRLEEKLEPL